MNLILSPGDKLIIDIEGSTVTFDSISADLRDGRIRHDQSIERGAVTLYRRDGKLLLVATVAGDFNGDGVVSIDDNSILASLRLLTGPDIAHRTEI